MTAKDYRWYHENAASKNRFWTDEQVEAYANEKSKELEKENNTQAIKLARIQAELNALTGKA